MYRSACASAATNQARLLNLGMDMRQRVPFECRMVRAAQRVNFAGLRIVKMVNSDPFTAGGVTVQMMPHHSN